MREIALFSGKIYTAGTNFTRPPVVTVATNLNSEVVSRCVTYHKWRQKPNLSELWIRCSSNQAYVWFGEPLLLIKSSICLIWWALLLIKSNTELLDGGKPLNYVISEIFLGQFSPKTSNLYIRNTYFAKKNQLRHHFMVSGIAQTFWTEPGRVATAYSADKYKDHNEQYKSAE